MRGLGPGARAPARGLRRLVTAAVLSTSLASLGVLGTAAPAAAVPDDGFGGAARTTGASPSSSASATPSSTPSSSPSSSPTSSASADGDAGAATDGTQAPAERRLYLVTLTGAGTAGQPEDPLATVRLRAEQDAVLGRVGSPAPVYRWTTALNGVAVRLTAAEADDLAALPEVALVEPNSVRTLAGRGVATVGAATAESAGTGSVGGAGTVVGVVDTGLDPASAAFADVPGLGSAPGGFTGTCDGEGAWGQASCTGKVVAGHSFVEGFGADRVSASASLSPLDTDGHGTQVASIAAGNSGVTVRAGGDSLGSFSGVAPQARVAVYKACWTAPDPADDGCATADLVAAIDQAARDGVDVLELAVDGPARLDTVELALLGAGESGAVVVAAAGNAGRTRTAAHLSPWVTTVGAVRGAQRTGSVSVASSDGRTSGPVLSGAMAATTRVSGRLVRGVDAVARGATRAAARLCEPGSLDAATVRDAVVLCERGGVGRIDKSAAVAAADGAGMVLVNTAPDGVDADLHAVPTVHLDQADGRTLERWVAAHPLGRATLAPQGVTSERARVPAFSAGGTPDSPVLKPDVVATGTDVLGVLPASVSSDRWGVLTGTSAASAVVAGAAARLAAATGLEAQGVRARLVAGATPLRGVSVLRQGAGQVSPEAEDSEVGLLVPDRGDYRDWLAGAGRLPSPGVVLRTDGGTARRTVVNAGTSTRTWRVRVTGLDSADAVARPATVTLAPGERATVRVSVGASLADEGSIVLRSTDGLRTRIPVLVRR
ncbi:S8 family serine peptidase [Nocardioides bruguierae]|uniref:S8 family serine peptidase n=1 Tax=Nocardioides bruguierae TaxID=2945102 RepID=UPI0020211F17|nr:S8 family serine peptidase [Nocardioides bruguierae]MCL8024172.1 S8 family serine peptidase [Nocardioides bruguierae]